MKKTLLTAIMLLTAVMAQAQNSVKINPVLKVGMQKTYTTRGEATTPGSTNGNFTGEMTYKVVDQTPEGYQIDWKSNITMTDANLMMQNMAPTDLMQLLNSLNVEMLTDKQGQISGIKNAEELTVKCKIMIDSLFNAIISKSPQIKNNAKLQDSMQKSISSVKEIITEDYLLEAYIQSPSITMLNGKTITNGMQEEGKYSLFKTKTTYTLLNGGKTIQQDTKGDIDVSAMKEYMLKMMGNLIPESVTKETNPEELSAMIEEMISNGNLQMDMNFKATYDIADDGWVKKLVIQMDMNAPGQTSKARQVITLKP